MNKQEFFVQLRKPLSELPQDELEEYCGEDRALNGGFP